MIELTTTLNAIKAHDPCVDGWRKLLKYLNKTEADDEPLSFAVIVESNGLEDALWACRSAPQHAREWRLYAVWCARQVQHLMTDPRSLTALDVAERHANGQATDDELDAAGTAARAAWAAAWVAAEAAADAAWAAARAAAGTAARAALAAGDAARDAARAAWAAAGTAARAAAGAAQEEKFLAVVRGEMR